MSVTLEFDREVDVSRGDLIACASAPAIVATRVKGWIVWMDQQPLEVEPPLSCQACAASHTVPVVINSLDHRTNIATLEHEQAATLEMNSIGTVTMSFLRPIAFDPYSENRSTGAFILIDPITNSTAAAGMISTALPAAATLHRTEEDDWGPVTPGERQARWGHRGGVLELIGPAALIDAVERSLFSVGVVTGRIDAELEEFSLHPQLIVILAEHHTRSGLLSLLVREQENGPLTARIEGHEISIDSAEPATVVAVVHQLLQSAAIFISAEGANI